MVVGLRALCYKMLAKIPGNALSIFSWTYFINLSSFPSSVNMNRFQKRGIFLNALFLFFLASVSYILIKYDLDRKISALFYSHTSGWKFADREPWNWLHRYGHIPGAIFAILSLILYIASLLKTRLARYRRYFLVVVLTAGIGGGVIVNVILKDNWGRPRPHQVKEFGGYWEYRHLNSPGIMGKGRSFSCGHCTMGYIFLTTVFFYENSKIIAIAGGTAGLLFGTLMSLARIGQGGHFASDTFWSLGIILITANTLYNLFLFPSTPENVSNGREQRRYKNVSVLGFSAIGAAALSGLFLSPVYEKHTEPLDIPAETEELYLKLNLKGYDLKILKSDNLETSIDTHITGRGSPSVDIIHKIKKTNREKMACVEYSLEVDGYLASAKMDVTLSVPSNLIIHKTNTNRCK